MKSLVVMLTLVHSFLHTETSCFPSVEDIETAVAILERRGEQLKLEVESLQDESPCGCRWIRPTKEHMKTVFRVKRGVNGCPCRRIKKNFMGGKSKTLGNIRSALNM